MALSQSALSELLDAIRAGGSEDVLREAMTLVLHDRRRQVRAHRRPDDPPQRHAQPSVVHQGRRCRAAHPQHSQSGPSPLIGLG